VFRREGRGRRTFRRKRGVRAEKKLPGEKSVANEEFLPFKRRQPGTLILRKTGKNVGEDPGGKLLQRNWLAEGP